MSLGTLLNVFGVPTMYTLFARRTVPGANKTVDKDQVGEVAHRLNVRPRKSLGWKCPAELFLPEGAFDFMAYWADQLKFVALGA